MKVYRQSFLLKILVAFVPLCLLSGLGVAKAQTVYIDITQPSFQRLPIAIPDFKYQVAGQPQLAREMAQTLSDDLDYSGVFRSLDPRGFLQSPQEIGIAQNEINFMEWRRLGAEFLARGAYLVQGSSVKLEMRLFDVVANRMVIGKVYEGQTKDWKAMIHRFADEILLALTGEKGVFGTKIAFVQIQGKDKEIYLVDFDGSNPVPVTQDKSTALSPAWSSDGGQLAYVSYKEKGPKIYIASLMSGSHRLLSGHPGLNIAPAWRPNSQDLAVTLSKDGNPDIFLLSSTGAIMRTLAQSWAINVSPSWSPDGSKLAFVSNETGSPQIYVLDVNSGRKQRITFSGDYNTSPAWSPKGDWIAYSGMSGGRHNIFVIRPDGGQTRQLTHGEGDNESPTWSPDGRMLAFSSTRQGPSAIWVLLMNGAGTRRLTNLGGSQEMPDWSPRLSGR
ncbi:MAG: Tol-Pal system beta propeller repeat protein TolB [Desulforhabdus sp.]|jgi:TolB protein|nr:Tol-Pal system beta propeller repeat protein TolB [Desulforhabdus sp.]